MTAYNPNAVGRKGSIFGYPYSVEEADLILIPVPWDVTASYGAGTSEAPELILNESNQLDLSIPDITKDHRYPVAMAPMNEEVKKTAISLRAKAELLISKLEETGELDAEERVVQSQINQGCEQMVEYVRTEAGDYLRVGKTVGVIGGDHSTPLGLIHALGEMHENFGILQIDAHMDLREAYEGFTYSHASIMKNALKVSSVTKLVQVGIRDYCEEEETLVKELNKKYIIHFDEVLQKRKWKGEDWPEQVAKIINDLPKKVYISFDMDGLDPSLCPNTGTPVPGGLSFYEAVFLIESVVRGGRKIIGFDVSETGNTIWDANVASRILFRLCACLGVSRGRLIKPNL
ncbi:MAG: agmatinase family protein [Cytophagales bacterium]|nr:agmatinase family protein [Cytophagales bacterium]